jgi:hypothetical protein
LADFVSAITAVFILLLTNAEKLPPVRASSP